MPPRRDFDRAEAALRAAREADRRGDETACRAALYCLAMMLNLRSGPVPGVTAMPAAGEDDP